MLPSNLKKGGSSTSTDAASTIAVVLSSCTLIWQTIQFMLTRSVDAKNRQFEAYHRLIKELVQPSENGATYVDRQCAAVFELKRFMAYKDLTIRTLTGLRDQWRTSKAFHPRLEMEIELTLGFLSFVESHDLWRIDVSLPRGSC